MDRPPLIRISNLRDHVILLAFISKVAGSYLRSVPGNKVHQYAKCIKSNVGESLAEKKGAKLMLKSGTCGGPFLEIHSSFLAAGKVSACRK